MRHVDHAGKIADSPDDKKQQAATTLLHDEIPKRDFAKPIASRVSRAFGQLVDTSLRGFCLSLQWYVYGAAISYGG